MGQKGIYAKKAATTKIRTLRSVRFCKRRDVVNQ